MWKVKQFLTRLIGKSIFKLFRSACFLFCFLLCLTADSAPVTNVDFVVVYGRHDKNMVDPTPWQTKYNSYPVGRLLFWTVIFDDTQTRGEIYRSESGHIGFIKQIDGGEVFVMANESGGPASWLLDTSTISVRYSENHSYYARPPHVWQKPFFDIFATLGVGNPGSLYNSTHGVISGHRVLLGIVGSNVGFEWRNFFLHGQTFSGVCPVVRYDYSGNGQIEYNVHVPFSYYSVYATWRSPLFDVPIDVFKMHLDSKWWIRGWFAFDSTGITGIGYGTGDQGVSGQTASGSSGGSGDGGGITMLPGAIDDPPQTPLGLNGRWVYDPETRLWNWVGDIADNADQLNPWDNSVMPENQERGLAQEATLRQVKAGIDGLAKENTLQQIRMTLEEFQRQQGITSDQLQAMIDNAVVEIVDGYVQYWEGKNLVEAIDNQGQNLVDVIDDRVSGVIGRLSIEGAGIKNAINQHKQVSSAISSRVSGLETGVSRVNTSIGAVNASIGEAKSDIVDAISNITMPENPTVDGQDVESYEITTPDLSSQIDGWFAFDFPQLTIARQFVFEDYDIGVFGWKIPFSAFNDSSLRIIINTVRNILTWLVYLSAVLGVFKAMGGGV